MYIDIGKTDIDCCLAIFSQGTRQVQLSRGGVEMYYFYESY